MTRWSGHRFSAAVTRTRRWRGLRLEALRRDGFACAICGAAGRLEVHHRKPVRDAPELAFDLNNLTSLCGRCHNAATRAELGQAPTTPARRAWREAVAELRRPVLTPETPEITKDSTCSTA